MAIVQGVIERKLSSLIGAKVTFQKFSASLLKGVIEAGGVRVGDDDERPFLTIVLVRAEISIKQALKGEIVVKSITVEKPIVQAIRWAVGTSNLPQRAPRTEPAEEKTSWKLDVKKLFIIDGQIGLRLGSYELRTGRVLAELNRLGDDYSLTFLAEDVRRIDREAMIGTISAIGTISGVWDLTVIPESSMKADLTIGDLGRITFTTPRIRSLRGQIELAGKITLAQIIALLPPRQQ